MNEPIKLSIAATSKRVDIATVVGLTFFNSVELPRRSQLDIAMGWRDSELGGTGPAILVGKKIYTFGFGNPVGLSAMAYRGRGFYRNKIPLRAIGVFPTWDRLIFAVRKDTGIQSLEEVRQRKYPLKISTRRRGKLQTTVYAIEEVLNAYGMSYREIDKWGGKILEAPSPSSAARKDHIQSGKADAVFDEGVKSWGQTAVDHGFIYLPIQGQVLKRLGRMGYRISMVPKSRFKGMETDVPTVDFSGWPMVVRADMPNDVAYALCEAIEKRKALIPTDNFKPVAMKQLCADDDEAPYNVPLHPGARRFYREHGYLK